jgi:methylaspartate mutase sigma subunit
MALPVPLAAGPAPVPGTARVAGTGDEDGSPRLTVLITGLASDAHTWNLIFLQKFVEECGHAVINLGPCVPIGLLVSECLRLSPDLVVVSSVNGHGVDDGRAAIAALRTEPALAGLPAVIGGKLSTRGELTAAEMEGLMTAGYDAVYVEAGLPDLQLLLTGGARTALASRLASCHALA